MTLADPLVVRLYRAALRILPRGFRERYGPGMEAMVRDGWRDRGGARRGVRRDMGRVLLAARALADLVWTAVAVRIGPSAGTSDGEATMRWTGMGMDLRASLRALRRAPMFTATASLSLALGFGGVATVYALADGMLLHPIQGVRAASELVEITPGSLPYPVVQDLQQDMRTLTGVAAHRVRSVALELGGDAEARPVQAGIVTGNYFDLLGVTPTLGRLLTPRDTISGASPVVVLSHALWTELGARTDVLGTDVRINGATFRVVGVAPAGFDGLRLWMHPAVWMPVESWPVASLGRTPDVHSRNWGWIAAVGRVAPGATLASVTDEVRAASERIGAAHPENRQDLESVAVAPARLRAADEAGPVLQALLLALGGMALLALLAAAANVASLLLARASRRARELAVRSALGAGRFQLARLAGAEGVMLVVLGAAVGVGLSWAALRALAAVSLPGGIRLAATGLHANPTLMGVGGALLLVVVAVSGLAPTLLAARTQALAVGSDRSGGAAPRGVRLRAMLAGVQIAAGVILLAGTLLFGQSMVSALAVDLGFEPGHMAVVRLDASLFRDDMAAAGAAVAALGERVREQPGVDAASWSLVAPLTSDEEHESFDIVGRAWAGNPPSVEIDAVGGDFFAAAGIPLVAGDASAVAGPIRAPVVVVNEAMARRYWPGESPVGAHVVLMGMEFPVVAVSRDTRFHGFAAEPVPMAYGVFPSTPAPSLSLVMRGPGSEALLGSIRGLAREVDARLVVADVSTGTRLLDFLLAPQRVGGAVAFLFSLLAVALCLTGVYGVVAYGVTARLREFGVRLTLGAEPKRVAGEVLRKNLATVVGGIGAGAAASVVLTRVASGFLFGVGASDALPTVLAAGAVLMMALVATWVPARRAGQVDPATVLAAE